MNNKNPAGKILHFLKEGMWDLELASLSGMKRTGVAAIRVIYLVVKGFYENECQLHASALTYTSLMAIVPIFAFATAILRGLGAGRAAEQHILAAIKDMPEQFQEFVGNLLRQIENVNFSMLGGLALLVLLWMVVSVFGQVEQSFNRVWGVKIRRSLIRRFADYLSILTIVPILVIAATTFNATIVSNVFFMRLTNRFGPAAELYSMLISLMPIVSTWIAFIFLYKFMPNTKVHIMPGLLSGIIGGSMWILWQRLYIILQVGVSRYNAIYATFASVPIFLIWLYMSWQIVLIGAEIGFALQNYHTYRMEQQSSVASMESKILLALSVMSHAAGVMREPDASFTLSEYAHSHRIPVRLINEVVNTLVEAKLIAQVNNSDDHYTLLRSPEYLKVKDVMDIMLKQGSSPEMLGVNHVDKEIMNVFGKADIASSTALSDMNIEALSEMSSKYLAQNPA